MAFGLFLFYAWLPLFYGLVGSRAMTTEANDDTPLSIGLLLRDLPKLIWALVLLITGVVYVAMKVRRHQWGKHTVQKPSVAMQKER